jgi:hypothetical protein
MSSSAWVEALGGIAGFCTTFAYVPQLAKGGAIFPTACFLSTSAACFFGSATDFCSARRRSH